MGTQARVRRQRRWQGNRAQEATRGRVEDGHRILVDAPDEDPAGGLVDGERRTVHFPGAPPRPPGAQRDRAQDAQARRIDSEQGGRRIAEGEDEEAMAPRVGRQVRVQRERLGREGRGGGPDRAAGGEVDRRDRHPRPARARRGRPGHERAPQPRVVGDGEPRASAGPGAGPPTASVPITRPVAVSTIRARAPIRSTRTARPPGASVSDGEPATSAMVATRGSAPAGGHTASARRTVSVPTTTPALTLHVAPGCRIASPGASPLVTAVRSTRSPGR